MDLSFRQSELFDPCLRSWALNYRKALQPKRQRPSKAGIGTLCHKWLEVWYDPALDDPDSAMTALWEASALTIEDRPEWVAEYEKHLKLCRIMVKGYAQWLEETGADAGLTVTGVERRLSTPWGAFEVPGVGTVNVTVTGQADLEVIDEWGMPRLLDHKTRDAIAGQKKPSDPQRTTYALLRMMEDNTLYAGGVHNVLRRVQRTAKAKPPFYGRADEIHFSVPALRKHWHHVQQRLLLLVPLAAAIQQETLALDSPRLFPSVDGDCSWRCDFFEMCPMFDDGSDWEWALNESFKPAATMEIINTEES